MNARTRMLALSAAAKVTLVGAFGCDKAPMVTAETVTGPASTPDAVAPLPTSSAHATSTASLCNIESTGAPTQPTLRCCQEAVVAAEAAKRTLASHDEIACCKALVTANDDAMEHRGAGQDMPGRDPCCGALNWQGSMTCTPWGPPVPPEMPEMPERRAMDGVA